MSLVTYIHIQSTFYIILCMCVCTCGCLSVCACVRLCHVEVNRQLAEVVLSFYHVGPRNRTWIVHKAWWPAFLPAEPSWLHPQNHTQFCNVPPFTQWCIRLCFVLGLCKQHAFLYRFKLYNTPKSLEGWSYRGEHHDWLQTILSFKNGGALRLLHPRNE